MILAALAPWIGISAHPLVPATPLRLVQITVIDHDHENPHQIDQESIGLLLIWSFILLTLFATVFPLLTLLMH